MTDPGLTAERRDELTALLSDEHRLRTEYPKVADYLDTASRLPGTDDPRADTAFDLRLVHFMTGGTSPTGNPYWDIVGPSVNAQNGRRVVNGGRATGSARLGYAQTILQSVYAYAVPSPQTLNWIADCCAGSPIVELGAGRGYWAAQLAAVGCAIDAYDSEPPGKAENLSFPASVGQRDTWHQVGDLSEYTVRAAPPDDHTLFLCWPPGWGNRMASEALAAYEKSDGTRVVFIGEPKGGKTGDDAFFDALTARWKLESQDPQFVSWWNLADVAQLWIPR
ncbi:hypothetical protein [Nocardia inohanensis]|uniref:hypothetical protein n=1 Tax=Nocardia inohanensis TaxID=209246 RepID=UPI00082AFCE3|nr:hypothetical protein [Nocardia inohanensis]